MYTVLQNIFIIIYCHIYYILFPFTGYQCQHQKIRMHLCHQEPFIRCLSISILCNIFALLSFSSCHLILVIKLVKQQTCTQFDPVDHIPQKLLCPPLQGHSQVYLPQTCSAEHYFLSLTCLHPLTQSDHC